IPTTTRPRPSHESSQACTRASSGARCFTRTAVSAASRSRRRPEASITQDFAPAIEVPGGLLEVPRSLSSKTCWLISLARQPLEFRLGNWITERLFPEARHGSGTTACKTPGRAEDLLLSSG